jgi:hypothetical protein
MFAKRRFFDSFQLKLIAACAMLIDHTAHVFFPAAIYMRCIGRIAFPIFAFMIAEGYIKTKSVGWYLFRLLIFSLLAQVPYSLMLGNYDSIQLNVIFTLMLGLASIFSIENGNRFIAFIAPLAFALIAEFTGMDHGAFGVLMVIAFFYTRNSDSEKYTVVSILILLFSSSYMLRYGINNYAWIIILFYFLPLPIIHLYNGAKGVSNSFTRWFFYVFYPAHMLLLVILNKITRSIFLLSK